MTACRVRAGAAVLTVLLATVVLVGCGSSPSLVGVWQGDDNTGLKTVESDGRCSGMYYNGDEPLDIGGGMTCQLGEKRDDGSYLLIVRQPPNERTYVVTFPDEDTAVLSGDTGVVVTLTRQ
ncbi:hypothetical protein [Microbacterium sp.]|uniref:hypothetical protein n=1 Tax=Microbacterium sp. TaxID=51671 RepID=UPI0039E51C36